VVQTEPILSPAICTTLAGARWVFRYLNYSKHLRRCYAGNSQEVALVGHSDSDYAGDATDRRSTMGYVFLLYGVAVTWAAHKQQSISTSTTEAEYVGLCNTAKKLCSLTSCLEIWDAGNT
jgi:hypothetical protein